MENDNEIRMLRAILADAIEALSQPDNAGEADKIQARLDRLDAKLEEE